MAERERQVGREGEIDRITRPQTLSLSLFLSVDQEERCGRNRERESQA